MCKAAACSRRPPGTEQQPLGGAGLGGQQGGVCEDIEAAVSECPGARLAGDWWFPEAPEVLKQMRVTTSMTRPIKGATGRKVRPQYSPYIFRALPFPSSSDTAGTVCRAHQRPPGELRPGQDSGATKRPEEAAVLRLPFRPPPRLPPRCRAGRGGSGHLGVPATFTKVPARFLSKRKRAVFFH